MPKQHGYSPKIRRAAVIAYRQDIRSGLGSQHALKSARKLAPNVVDRTIFNWLRQDNSDEATASRKSRSGRPRKCTARDEYLIIGHAIRLRESFLPIGRDDLTQFARSYLGLDLSPQYVGKLLQKYGFSYQIVQVRSSRMVTTQVVDESVDFIRNLRAGNWDDDAILVMDETGLWSNTVCKSSYHFRGWYEILDFFSPLPLFFNTFHHHLKIDLTLLLSCTHPTSSIRLPFCMSILTSRYNAVVKNHGDSYRDTMVACVRGDGVDIPPFFIISEYANASHASNRRPLSNKKPVKGMNNAFMKEWLDYLLHFLTKPSVLIMDRLSSHTAKLTTEYISTLKLPDGRAALTPMFLPPKSAFLISPLDMGGFAAMKAYYYKLDRSTLDLKLAAAKRAWSSVSNDSVRHFFENCGLVGSESLQSIRKRLMKQVRCGVPEKLIEVQNYYDGWRSGAFQLEHTTPGRNVVFANPEQLSDGELDGVYWKCYGGARRRSGYF